MTDNRKSSGPGVAHLVRTLIPGLMAVSVMFGVGALIEGRAVGDPALAQASLTVAAVPAPTATPAARGPAAEPTPTPAYTPPPDAATCPDINGFSITILTGEPTCAHINKAARMYTAEVLGDKLGRELRWAGEGHSCIRNFDSTGITSRSHGLICVGTGHSFLLYYR
ncbi:MAG: hypothetical protein FWG25_00210 [Promicromonosporaceae bacterium]|nr:hypothetical protein [Promicromonosporaceae bacterium]